jgi:hypothetical protein
MRPPAYLSKRVDQALGNRAGLQLRDPLGIGDEDGLADEYGGGENGESSHHLSSPT